MLKGQNLTFNLNKLFFFFENHNENFDKCLFIVSKLFTAPTLVEEEMGGSLCSGVFYFFYLTIESATQPTDRLWKVNYRA